MFPDASFNQDFLTDRFWSYNYQKLIPKSYPKMTQRAVIYARVSSVGDRQSTTRQVEDLKRYISLNDMELINKELIDAGWQVAITWQKDGAPKQWWPNLQNRLTVLGIESSEVVYFPHDTYEPKLDATMQELGFSIAVVNKKEEENPLQLQHEEGVWHVGAVGMMTSKPRLWLREAVAQDANLAYLIGFQLEEELYNENSFRSMLNCFDEYEATEELITSNIDEAREHFHGRSAGVSPEIESQYQEKKAALEKELSEVKKQLEKIDAKY